MSQSGSDYKYHRFYIDKQILHTYGSIVNCVDKLMDKNINQNELCIMESCIRMMVLKIIIVF